MNRAEGDDVALKLLHTADWHLGKPFHGFDEADRIKLTRARLDVLDAIFAAAEHHAVDGVLCAGDLFDDPNPPREWWEGLQRRLVKTPARRPIFLLPGNHDPIVPQSVYDPGHPSRRGLPGWVHVVDRDDFSYALNELSILVARPCRSQAGQDDPALALPRREAGDERIRIGLVHGSTFDAADCQTNFPIAKDAAARRGLDYLAIGDTHSFRDVPPGAKPPVVYPGAPEPTSFDEPGAGRVVLVFVSRDRRVRFRDERVARWTWASENVRTIEELRELATTNLDDTVLRLSVDLRVSAAELEEAEAILRDLKGSSASKGRVGILQMQQQRLLVDTRGIEEMVEAMPDVLRATVERLRELEAGEQADVARMALRHLVRLLRSPESR